MHHKNCRDVTEKQTRIIEKLNRFLLSVFTFIFFKNKEDAIESETLRGHKCMFLWQTITLFSALFQMTSFFQCPNQTVDSKIVLGYFFLEGHHNLIRSVI